MTMYVASFTPKKSAVKSGAKEMATLIEAKTQKLAAMAATMLLEELFPGSSENFFNPTITEDCVGSPRPGIGRFSTEFMDENELVEGVWTRKPDPAPIRPTELSLQEKIAALVLLGKTDLDDHDYSLVLDFFADDESGDDDTHTIVSVLSQYPAVAAMYPVRVTELVAAIEKKFNPPIDAAAASAFVNNWIYGTAERPTHSAPPSAAPAVERVWTNMDRLDIGIASCIVTDADTFDGVSASDVARAKELAKSDDQMFQRWSMAIRLQNGALSIPGDVLLGLLREAKKRPELLNDANARQRLADKYLAVWREGAVAHDNQHDGDDAQQTGAAITTRKPDQQPDIQNLGGGRFSIDGLIGPESSTSNQGEKTEASEPEPEPAASVAQQARQALDEIGYGIYAGGDEGGTPAPADDFQARAAAVESDIEEKPVIEQENLNIWKRVQRTDPRYTKPLTGAGFEGTSINSEYMFMRATEIFGPAGSGWGYRILEEKMFPGAPLSEAIYDDNKKFIGTRMLRDADGSLISELNHSLKIALWYINDSGGRSEIEAYGATPYMYKTQKGIKTDSEVIKKSLTDAIKKALSLLGFSADVWLGMHDNPEYVAENEVEFSIKRASEKAVDVTRLREELDEKLGRAAETIKAAVSENEASKVFGVLAREVDVHRKNAEAKGDSEHARYLAGRLRRLSELKDTRIAELKTKEGEKA
ncbi:exodeoxyribonuclease VIII-like protein [Dickeya fangzhongdai]|uniref:exodeoxyribonuclease VIII-like protein n=1 Tax=Dickeya fangzhongdai TaxID=1778540 RepID=UPI0023E4446E|nr:exodeoxyribonuclease VIII-like protein [Dickeya fangzhongdai]WES88816.1 exodeoxyribonuclease VIII-like protein [Dickeya fangzhongdai]